MGTSEKIDKMYVRPTPGSRHALRTLLVALQAPDLFGPDLTQEDLVCASWLWIGEMDVPSVAKEIGPHVEAIRAQRLKLKRVPSPEPPPAADVISQPGLPPKRNKRMG